jgi:hypothetical protein
MADTVLTTAKFIGEDESQGFKKGKKYALDIQETPESETQIMVRNHYGEQFCPYDNRETFEANWEMLGPDVMPDFVDFDTPERKQPEVKPGMSQILEVEAYKVQSTDILDPTTYKHMKLMARDFIGSGAVPKAFTNEMQVLMALQAGYEMGMKPMESLQSLYIVNGAMNVWGKAVTRRLTSHGWKPSYEDGGSGDEQFCTATITNSKTGESHSETYKFSDAVLSRYTTDNNGKLKPGWLPGMNRKLKLRYGALSVLIKGYVPEVLGAADNIAEVAIDIKPDDEQDPQDERKARMAAADAKREEMTKGNHAPKPVAAQHD